MSFCQISATNCLLQHCYEEVYHRPTFQLNAVRFADSSWPRWEKRRTSGVQQYNNDWRPGSEFSRQWNATAEHASDTSQEDEEAQAEEAAKATAFCDAPTQAAKGKAEGACDTAVRTWASKLGEQYSAEQYVDEQLALARKSGWHIDIVAEFNHERQKEQAAAASSSDSNSGKQ